MDRFTTALDRLQKCELEVLFGNFFSFFKSIGEMDVKEVIAAYQSLKLYARARGIHASDHPLKPVWSAIISRMEMVLFESDQSRRSELAIILSRATEGIISLE